MSFDVWSLPRSVEIGGVEVEIETDYRAVLDICTALVDTELTDEERAYIVLNIFYPHIELVPIGCGQEMTERLYWFIDGGERRETRQRRPKLVDWAQDYPYIIAPVNKALGFEARAVEYLHWWSFLAAYREIEDCTFAQIVNIRNKLARRKKLDRAEREWYNANRDIVDLKRRYTDAEDDLVRQWTGGGNNS